MKKLLFTRTPEMPTVTTNTNQIQILLLRNQQESNRCGCRRDLGSCFAHHFAGCRSGHTRFLSSKPHSLLAQNPLPDHLSTPCALPFHPLSVHQQAPIDPHVVLGGFPPSSSNYSGEATSFVVTLPLSSAAGDVAAARAWEEAFVQLAKGRLTEIAAAAGLSIAFSTERWVGRWCRGVGKGPWYHGGGWSVHRLQH